MLQLLGMYFHSWAVYLDHTFTKVGQRSMIVRLPVTKLAVVAFDKSDNQCTTAHIMHIFHFLFRVNKEYSRFPGVDESWGDACSTTALQGD